MDPNREDGELEDGELSDDEETMPTLPPVIAPHVSDNTPIGKFNSPPRLSVQDDNAAYGASDTDYPQPVPAKNKDNASHVPSESRMYPNNNQVEHSHSIVTGNDDKEGKQIQSRSN